MMDTNTIITNVVTILQGLTSGGNSLFVDVLDYECRAMPPDGIIASVYFARMAGSPLDSGLAASSGVFVLNVRLYVSTVRQPYGQVERSIVSAAQQVIGALTADFELGGAVRNIDLLGAGGVPLGAEGGYIPGQDGKLMRVITITLPSIVSDVWEQTP